MNSHALRLALLFLVVVLAPRLHADDTQIAGAVRAADDQRVAAMLAADPKELDALCSDQLFYAHSNGKRDTKASFIESLVSRHTVYESLTYEQRDFQPIAPGAVLMSGRATLHVNSSGKKSVIPISFLAVWREENGRWRFVGWQSSKLPALTLPVPPVPPAAPIGAKARTSTT